MNIKDMAINNKTKFLRCQNGIAYYALTVPYSEMLYSFPVPLNSTQDEALTAEGHTIHFMDYIHKAIREGTLLKEVA
jgi:hypothetical protein